MSDTKMDSELSQAVATILHHQVRKTLMGDLGLTRDSIHAEARKIVEEAVQKSITNMMDNGSIQRVINDYLTRQLNLKKVAEDEVKAAVGRIVNTKMSITLNH